MEPLRQGRVALRIGLKGAAIGEGAVDVLPLDQHVADAAPIGLAEKLRERDVL